MCYLLQNKPCDRILCNSSTAFCKEMLVDSNIFLLWVWQKLRASNWNVNKEEYILALNQKLLYITTKPPQGFLIIIFVFPHLSLSPWMQLKMWSCVPRKGPAHPPSQSYTVYYFGHVNTFQQCNGGWRSHSVLFFCVQSGVYEGFTLSIKLKWTKGEMHQVKISFVHALFSFEIYNLFCLREMSYTNEIHIQLFFSVQISLLKIYADQHIFNYIKYKKACFLPHSPLKDKFTEKGKFCHHLLTSIPMESHVKFCSAQKILRALPQNNIGPCSYTAEVDVDLF